jgi:hypothetical protein
MIKFDELDHASVYINDISITETQTKNGYSVGRVNIAGIRTDLKVTTNTGEDLVMVAYEKIKEKAYDSMDKIKDTVIDNSKTDELIGNPEPLSMSDDVDKICGSKGFVIGAIVDRILTIDDLDCNKLGVCTGWFVKDKAIRIRFSDGLVCDIDKCEVIDDVNKTVFKFISDEKHKISIRAKELQDNIDLFLNNLIYEE